MSKVNNPASEVPSGKEMNDENYLKDMLDTIKAISGNMGILTSEASNETLVNKLEPICKDIKNAQRKLFELIFKNGWYVLEQAEQNKIDEKITELNTKLEELNSNE